MAGITRRTGRLTLHLLCVVSLFAGSAHAQVELHGFLETALGVRTATDPMFVDSQDYTLQETRAQLRANHYGDAGEVFVRLDFTRDHLLGDRIEVELREGYARFNLFHDRVEVKAGRQALTWGTGDLIFVNDLFPKDFVSFFAGREDQYLKAPADAMRLGFFGLPFDAEIVLMPEFTPDRTPTGKRLSFYSPPGAIPFPERPESTLENGEVALRLSGYVGSSGWALYGYHGFWPTPVGLRLGEIRRPLGGTPLRHPFHPQLSVLGASLRGSRFGGIYWLESGYYLSQGDSDGDDPFIPNSLLKGLIGFERQLLPDFNVGFQYYLEYMQDHDLYLSTLPAGSIEGDELRQMVTLRLERFLLYQTLRLSLFTFASPTDEDLHTRAMASYKVNDEVEITGGLNLFAGETATTLFGQMDKNDNLYMRIRYSF